MAMSSFVCLFVILSVCLTFFSAMLEHRKFYFGQLPRYGQLPKPIEIQPDQTMVIRLISLKTTEAYISLYNTNSRCPWQKTRTAVCQLFCTRPEEIIFLLFKAKSAKMACILKTMHNRGIVTVNDIYDIVRAFIWYHKL